MPRYRWNGEDIRQFAAMGVTAYPGDVFDDRYDGAHVAAEDGIEVDTPFLEHVPANTPLVSNGPQPGELVDQAEEAVHDGTVNGIKAWVGGDPELAQAALTAEQERPKPRTSLVTHLEALVAPGAGEDDLTDSDPEA